MDSIVKIDFCLMGTTVVPKEISKLTGIEPDVELMRGERDQKRDLPRLNLWSKESCVQSDDVGDHWNNLEPILGGSREILKTIAKTGKAKLTIVITCTDRIPSIQIPSEMSAFAGFVGAVIEIDHIQF